MKRPINIAAHVLIVNKYADSTDFPMVLSGYTYLGISLKLILIRFNYNQYRQSLTYRDPCLHKDSLTKSKNILIVADKAIMQKYKYFSPNFITYYIYMYFLCLLD